jgi:hypothetical protein
VSGRLSPTEKIRGQIDALFDGSRNLVEVLEEVARLGAELIIQAAVEAEVTEFLGRARYRRAADCPGCAGRQPQRLLPDHGQDHRRAGDHSAAEAARHDRAVLFAAVRQGHYPVECVGGAGDCRGRARIVDPGCGGDAGPMPSAPRRR